MRTLSTLLCPQIDRPCCSNDPPSRIRPASPPALACPVATPSDSPPCPHGEHRPRPTAACGRRMPSSSVPLPRPPRGRPRLPSIQCINPLVLPQPFHAAAGFPCRPTARRDQAPRAEYVRFWPSFSRPRSYTSPAPPRSLPSAHPHPLLPPGRTDAVRPRSRRALSQRSHAPSSSSPVATFAGRPRLRCPSHGLPIIRSRLRKERVSGAASWIPLIPFEGGRSAPMTPYALMSPARPEATVPRKGLVKRPRMLPGWPAF
ncbi:hypothetical protein C8Q79DRAFT_720927 [Trametes meyenii]|nr:hypothetical protein C8Q79DRAFT_720927 [Trametes meyenii]